MGTRHAPAKGTKRLPLPARRDQLLDVAEKLFVENGYAAVTMEDIARAAGVTRPIPYKHFGTKEGVYLGCVQRARAGYEKSLLTAFAPDDEPRVKLAKGAEAFFEALESNPGRWLLLFGGNTVLPADYSDDLAALRFSTINAIADVLRSSAPRIPERRLQALAHAVSGVGERLGHWWLAEPSMTRAELVEHYTEICWAGLSAYVDDD
ncbi:TetR/AcrR family transcriptional regulator [Spirillospora sp. NPDC047279]|uniref:TetR/AcrR family transcriptional regulator n=1 Tax=Spirillospora sp. NPDC047279 TaxID=3155478 RepID=UPI0033E90537